MKKYFFKKNDAPAGMQVRKQQRTLEFQVSMWNLSVHKNWDWQESVFDFLTDMNHGTFCFLQVNNEYQIINTESEIVGYLSEIN